MAMITSDDVRTGFPAAALSAGEAVSDGRPVPSAASRFARLFRRVDPFIVVGAASAVVLELGWLALLGAGLRRLFF
ncbi:MAG TPA: hypothetical protein VGD08_10830 [Stellaceae bacterium]|jgi:hypothetical protein